MVDYRARIYQYYATARDQTLAPQHVEGLGPRGPGLRQVIREHFPADRNAKILDLGSGHGAFVYFIREAGYTNVIGVDRSPEQVAEAERLGIAGIHEGDLMKTLKSLPEISQDVVIAFDVVEHFTMRCTGSYAMVACFLFTLQTAHLHLWVESGTVT
jgi:SAM-dependent methyltransferase